MGPGAVYAGLGIGLLFTYRASGVLNLAHGTMAMYPAYVYASLAATGDLVLPGVPGTLHVGDIGTLPRLLIVLAVSAALGWLAHTVVFGPLGRRGAPPLASVVAAVGIHLVLEAVVVLRLGAAPRFAPSVLPATTVEVAGSPVPVDRILLAAVAVAIGVATAWFQSRTRVGLASRAMSEDEVATSLLGHSPHRLGAINWVIGAMLAGLFGVLLAPITGLSPNSYSFLVVPALAAAVAGAFSSVATTVAAGLVLGVVQSQLTRAEIPVDWLGPQVLREVVPFVALASAVVWRGALVPRRGAPRAPRLPPADAPRHATGLVVAVVAIGATSVALTSGAYRSAVIVTMIGGLLCLSLVVLTGYAGQISLAQMSFAGVAGFALSVLTTELAIPFPVAPLLATALAGVCGVIVGVPALRARGVSFAVMTLGGALAVNELVFRNLSNGVLQANTVEAPTLGALDLAPVSPEGKPTVAFGLSVLAALSAAVVGVVALRRSAYGRRLVAVRANERGAAAAGVNVAATKLVAFGVSGCLAGLAGAFMGYHQEVVSAGSFGLSRSFATLAAAYLGGIGSVTGALLGGLIVTGGVVPTLFDRVLHIGRYQTLLSGAAMVAVAVRNPEGIAAAVRGRVTRRLR